MISIIHAGGESSRMQSIFKGPKALLPIGNPSKPLLWYHLQPLINSGLIEEYIFTLREKSNLLSKYIRRIAEEFGIKVKMIVEPKPLGRAGAVKYGILNGIISLDKEYYLMSHPDDLIPINVRQLLEFQKEKIKSGVLATLVMAKYAVSQFGIGIANENLILEKMEEKPELPLPEKCFASTGMCLYTKKAMEKFLEIDNNIFCHPETTVLPKLIEERKIAIFTVPRWFSLNFKDDYLRIKDMKQEELLNFLNAKQI
jgi:NDP-sugar pyrophosphorylase family protein